MKLKQLFIAAIFIAAAGFLTQCEKGPGAGLLVDDDSDRPDWAQGNTELNDHINQNDDSGTTRGGDYGDLYVLKRDANGVPIMTVKEVEGELFYYVQPLDIYGNELELDSEGELLDPESAIEVDFGRLNIVRSPESVLDQAFEEAMKVLTGLNAVITLDFCGRLTSTYTDALTGETIVKTIDSPRENMAIYKYIMTYMFRSTETFENRLGFLGEPPYNFDPLVIAASCFAAGSDKTGTVDIDEVVYINGFIDCIGLNPILNEYEYDFNDQNKYYFNFGDCYKDEQYMFMYNRPDVYADRYIRFLVWDGYYYEPDDMTLADERTFSILEVMEGLVDGESKFTYMWNYNGPPLQQVEAFAVAVDDAVQVLEYIHGDSNIIFLPDYSPAE